MCDHDEHQEGTIAWCDLTVPDADSVKEFYAAVTGWDIHPVSMGAYDDYEMRPHGSDHAAAGICHARGDNALLPPQWLVYIRVNDVEKSAEHCQMMGGEVLDGPRPLGSGLFCVIKDPAGAVAALYEEG